MDLDVTKKVAAALEREGVRYVIIGGIALNLLGLVRTTEDLDLFVDLEPVRVDLDGQPIWVASPRTLYKMKKGTVRPKDWGDAAALRQSFHLEDD